MKHLVAIVETAIWWIVRFFLWCSVVLGPIFCTAYVLRLFGVDLPGHEDINGIGLSEQSDYLYALSSVGLLTAAGYLYVFRYRREIETRRDIRSILVSCFLASMCILFSFEARYFRTLVLEATPLDVAVSFVDAYTGKPLRSLSMCRPCLRDPPRPFFRPLSISPSGGDGITHRFRGVSIPSVTFEYVVSADGYPPQRIHISSQRGDIPPQSDTRVVEMRRNGTSKAIDSDCE